MTPAQLRQLVPLLISALLAGASAISSGWISDGFLLAAGLVLIIAGRRRLRHCWKEGL